MFPPKSPYTSSYPLPPIDCGHDLVDVLVDLKVKVDLQVLLLDGRKSRSISLLLPPIAQSTTQSTDKSPKAPVAAIIAAIKVAIDLVAKIDLKVAFIDVDISLCVSLLVEIILVGQQYFVARNCELKGFRQIGYPRWLLPLWSTGHPEPHCPDQRCPVGSPLRLHQPLPRHPGPDCSQVSIRLFHRS